MILIELNGTEDLETLHTMRDGVRLMRHDLCDKDKLADISETVSVLDDAILDLL